MLLGAVVLQFLSQKMAKRKPVSAINFFSVQYTVEQFDFRSLHRPKYLDCIYCDVASSWESLRFRGIMKICHTFRTLWCTSTWERMPVMKIQTCDYWQCRAHQDTQSCFTAFWYSRKHRFPDSKCHASWKIVEGRRLLSQNILNFSFLTRNGIVWERKIMKFMI